MIDLPAASKSARRPIFFGWYIVAASVVTNTLLSAAFFQGFGVLIIPIEHTFGWDRWVISAAMSMRQLLSSVLSPGVGLLLDRVSARKLILWSAVVSGIGFIALGLTTGLITFFLFFLIVCLGASGVSHAVTWPVIIARWFRRNRGLAIGLAVMGPIFGTPLVILNMQIEEAHGWRVVLFAYGALVLIGIALLSMLVRDRPEPYGLRPDGDPPEENTAVDLAAVAAQRRAESGLTLRVVLRTKEFWLFFGYLSGTFTINSAIQVHMIPYFEQDVGLTAAWSAVVMAMVYIASGVGRIGGGYLLDRIDYRYVLAAVAAAMGLSLVYLQVMTVKSLWSTVPFSLMFGISLGCLVPMRAAVGAIMFGTRAIGGILGLLQGGSIAAGVVGPLVMGLIFDMNGNYSAAIWGLIVVGALMVPLSLAMASPAELANRLAR